MPPFSSLDELGVFARQRGVEILLENIRNDLASAQRLHLFNEMTHLNMNYVFDAGHAHIVAGVAHEFGLIGAPRIRSSICTITMASATSTSTRNPKAAPSTGAAPWNF